MIYEIVFSEDSLDDIRLLKRSEPKTYQKLETLLLELQEHPQTGTGKVEKLKGDKAELWSRRINKRHRLIYKIKETEVLVLVLSAYGHYGDK